MKHIKNNFFLIPKHLNNAPKRNSSNSKKRPNSSDIRKRSGSIVPKSNLDGKPKQKALSPQSSHYDALLKYRKSKHLQYMIYMF